jgi:peroxiredoxin Q/BCP
MSRDALSTPASGLLMKTLALALLLVGSLSLAGCAKRSGGPQVGDAAPDVSAPAADGAIVHVRQYAGHPVVLYFYPKDFTGGCTEQACSLRDRWAELQAEGAVVLGVSTQDADSHKKFAAEHKLPFPLLVDDGTLSKAFGVGKLGFLLDQRVTFLLDAQGKVAKVWDGDIDTKNHGRDVLAAVRALPHG